MREQLSFWEHLQDNGIPRLVGSLLQTPVQQVVVLVDKTWKKAKSRLTSLTSSDKFVCAFLGDTPTIDVVGDLPSVVQETELVSLDGLASLIIHHLVRDKVLMLSNSLGKLDEEGGISNFPRTQTLLIQHRYDPLMPLLHQVTDNLVVEVLHRLPLKTVEMQNNEK